MVRSLSPSSHSSNHWRRYLANNKAVRMARSAWRWSLYLGQRILGQQPRTQLAPCFVERPAVAGSWCVEVRVAAESNSRQEAEAWLSRQTLAETRLVAINPDGTEAYRLGLDDQATPTFFFLPDRLETLPPWFLEAAWLILAAEQIDALYLGDPATTNQPTPDQPQRLLEAPWRAATLFRAEAWRADQVDLVANQRRLIAKTPLRHLGRQVEEGEEGEESDARFRRGPYLANYDFGPAPLAELADAARYGRLRNTSEKPHILVLSSFLARGGAEHTLFETLRHLGSRFEFTFVTLAPHSPELGDRREDFLEISPRIFSLGDWVHPAAMVGQLSSLIASTGTTVIYNANGTTLFYDFAAQLKQRHPSLRILDHLYDHQVGYIEFYDDQTRDSVDVCIAENQRIAEVLIEQRHWPAERVPVIWPCGRRQDAFPATDQRTAVRQRVRRQLGYQDDDIIVLTAARMHSQKRPLDLVELASRLSDSERLAFLVVGGGELEDQVDSAISRATTNAKDGYPLRIQRLPFRTDIPDLIVAADVGCLVSSYEGLPVFLLECLQAGRPFLGTAVGDMAEVLRETHAGWIVEQPGDLDALEQTLRNSVLNDAERLARARDARLAGERFGVAACAERYAAVFIEQLTKRV